MKNLLIYTIFIMIIACGGSSIKNDTPVQRCIKTESEPPSNCPVTGNSYKFRESDSLKNRNIVGQVNNKITIDSILKRGLDLNRFNPQDYVSIEGYVYLVKLGNSETCNCDSKNPSDQDIHIEIVKNLNSVVKRGIGTNIIIVEINRYTRQSIDYNFIKTLVNKKVQVQGWMFCDKEHKQNSFNTANVFTNVWRATCWEIHPVMSINEVK